MKFLGKSSRRILRREFFATKDCDPYGIKEFDDIGVIVDIGANVGLFSLQSRFVHPVSRIVAIEPDPDVNKMLVDNVSNLMIETHRVMLGDDGMGSCLKGRRSVGYRCEQNNESGDVSSLSLSSMVRLYDIDVANAFFKIDCEGGETVLMDSEKSMEILANSIGFGMEIHNKPYFEFWNNFFDSLRDRYDIEVSTRRAMHVKAKRK